MNSLSSSVQKAGGKKSKNISDMLTKLNKIFGTAYGQAINWHRSLGERKYDYDHIKHYLTSDNVLTKDEVSQINKKWGGLKLFVKYGYDFFRGLKPLFGFDPNFVPSSYFYPYIEGILNPLSWKKQLSHKSFLEMLYCRGVKTPETILRSFGGVFLDKSYRPLTLKEAAETVSKCDFDLLFKPATDSEQGHGIVKYSVGEIPTLIEKIKDRSIFSIGSDFVLQRLIKQDSDTAIFNPTSLNCMRLTTLNLNGQITVGSMALKCGPKDSVVDNIGCGKRGVMVGISADGTLADRGFYGNGEMADSHNGIIFKGKKIVNFPKLIATAIDLHEYAPMCAVIGWDLALDSDGAPILIEGNTMYPGISVEQMCSGPIFGSRTDEVIDFLRSKMGGGKLL